MERLPLSRQRLHRPIDGIRRVCRHLMCLLIYENLEEPMLDLRVASTGVIVKLYNLHLVHAGI